MTRYFQERKEGTPGRQSSSSIRGALLWHCRGIGLWGGRGKFLFAKRGMIFRGTKAGVSRSIGTSSSDRAKRRQLRFGLNGLFKITPSQKRFVKITAQMEESASR